MFTVRQLGKTYHADWMQGSSRVRGSLGTRSESAARRVAHRLETALSEGSSSTLWPELKAQLPADTFTRFANQVGYRDADRPSWSKLRELFETQMTQRVAIHKMSPNTQTRYKQTLREFDLFLQTKSITLLEEITRPLVEEFKVWRLERSNKRKQSRGGGGLVLEAAILHRIFSYAMEHELVVKNPVRLEGRPGENPERGAHPFTGEQLAAMRLHANGDLLSFLVLRWTGLRGSDAVTLLWREVDLEQREIERITRKRKKRVILPIHDELLGQLRHERDSRKPSPSDHVLLNPETGRVLSRPRLYNRMLALGKRAGVPEAHPHRFRDTLAVDLLLRGSTPYDVAKTLGDTIETVERHYTPFVKELRERVRSILAKDDAGLESTTPRL